MQTTLFDIDSFTRKCETRYVEERSLKPLPNIYKRKPQPKQLEIFPKLSTPPREPRIDNIIPFPVKKTIKQKPIQWYRKFFWRKRIPIEKIREWGGGSCRYKQTYINAYEYFRNQKMDRKTQKTETEDDSNGDRIRQTISREFEKEKTTTTTTTDQEALQGTTDFVPPPVALFPEPEEEPESGEIPKPNINKPPKPMIGDTIKIVSGVGLAGDRHDKFFEVLDVNYSGVFYMHEGKQYWEQDTGYEICDDFW
ncbi:MAG: hypothetical protein F6K22_27490 [Okeania sp. SIO2F4]|uniref:hypothetical protein n=1 Tax=Okeania sp. SIO2F4 TaxID=2607790 RepID=UPI001429D446|nr:hypothetical protein [Okeania sp. SIO2F4]NES06225.1 hypothetical protein [Okeania sp. SIO2F4]